MANDNDGEIQEIPIVTDQEQESFDQMMSADEKALDDSLAKKGIQATPAPKEDATKPTEPKAVTQDPSKTDEQKKADEAGKPAESKEPSKYEKAKAREAEAWKKIEADKAAIKAEREALAQERAAAKTIPKAAQPLAKDYEAFSVQRENQYLRLLAKSKDSDLTEAETNEMHRAKYDADAAREEAKRLAPIEAQQAQRSQQVEQSTAQQNESWAKVKQEFPAAVEKGTPLNLALISFLEENRDFIASIPNGPHAATMFVQAQLEASRVPVLEKDLTALKETNAQLQKRVDELTKATSLTSGGAGAVSRPTGDRSFGQMSSKEMEAELDRELAGTS